MRAQDFPATTLRKFRTPSTWGAILGYGMAWAGLRLLTDLPGILSPRAEFLVPFLLVAGLVALGPLPWLWTGDERRQAPPWRGLIQALPWNTAWLGAFLWLFFLVAPESMGSRPEIQFHLFGHHYPMRPEWGLFLLNFPFALIMGWFLADKERAEASERELKLLADRARAQALQAQLNPHVLFNVLSGLTELVHEDPDAAEEALVGLIEMYRELTKHGSALTTSLRSERNLIERYLEIEEIRLGERLCFEWEWPSWADALELPPLLLQPLVENAIKHGISPSPRGGTIQISAERGPDKLVLIVANNGQPLEENHRDGMGLGNLKQRLALLTAFCPILDLYLDGDWTVAKLTLAWRWAT
jgi:signal transduction histidine kinase